MKFTPKGKKYVKERLSEINSLFPEKNKIDLEGNWREFKRDMFGLDVTLLINREKRVVQMLVEGVTFDKGSPKSEKDEIEIENWFDAFEVEGMKTLVEVTNLRVLYEKKSPEFSEYIIM